MGLPKISFIINTMGLGLLPANIQKTPALCITGTTVAGKIAIGESKQFFSLEDALNSGITPTDNPFAYKHVKDFYDFAGTGAELWLMLASSATLLSAMADKNQNIAKKLVNDAGGRVRVLGLIKQSTTGESIANGLVGDTHLAAINLHALAEEFTLNYFPIRGLLSGNSFTGNAQDLKDYSTSELNRVGIAIANTDGEKEASMGLLLAKIASTAVQRKISRVKDGAVNTIAAYFTNGKKVETLSSAWDSMADKNYIFLRNFVGKAGFYFSSDPTLSKDTDDFKSLSNGFVMDKALLLAYNVLVENLSDDITLTNSGQIHPAIIKTWQTEVENAINGNMTRLGELSACKCVIDAGQNIISTGQVVVEIKLLPVGYAEYITVKIGFTTQINN